MNNATLRTMREFLELRSRTDPARPYLISPLDGAVTTYGDLRSAALKLAVFLADLGLSPGRRVAVRLPAGRLGAELLVGAIAAGYSVVPIGVRAAAPQIANIVEHSEARLFIGEPRSIAAAKEALTAIGQRIELVELTEGTPAPWLSGASPSDWPNPPLAPEDEAAVLYTSGTTGQPKGVRLSQAGLLAAAGYVAQTHELRPEDRVLSCLPLNHINALNVTILAPLWSGGGAVLADGFLPWTYWQYAAKFRCTWLNATPIIIAMLLCGDAPDPELDPARIRFVRSASAPLPKEYQSEFIKRFNFGIIECMGLTEMSGTVLTNPLEREKRKNGSAGQLFGVSGRIVSPEDGRILGAGQEGELQLKGPTMMLGYLKDPEGTRATLTDDGWLKTGDLARRDAEGYHFITGRIKELIIKGGENIAPKVIDEALLRHEAVLAAAAFAVPDQIFGQEVEAAVVLKPGRETTGKELAAFCREYLSETEVPRKVHLVSEIPAGSSGKVQRLRLLQTIYPKLKT